MIRIATLLAAPAAAFMLSGCLVVTGVPDRQINVEIDRDGREDSVVAPARNPIDLRRTTLIVRNMDQSLAFYRDALGMTVSYDQIITSRDGLSQSHLVLLKANDDQIGMLGLWELEDAADAPAPEFGEEVATGEIVLLFNTSELDTVFPAASAMEGVTVMSPPTLREYPGDGVTFRVMVSMLRDPDGHIVELNNRLSPPLEWD